jgi:hypothetical protein
MKNLYAQNPNLIATQKPINTPAFQNSTLNAIRLISTKVPAIYWK